MRRCRRFTAALTQSGLGIGAARLAPVEVVGLLGVVLLCLLGALGAIVLIAVVVPIHFAASAVFESQRVGALARASWGMGLLNVEASTERGIIATVLGLRLYRYRAGAEAPPEPAKPRARRTKRRMRGRLPSWLDYRALLRLGVRVLRSLRLRARILGRLGAGDPADTAALYGTLVAAQRLVPSLDLRRLSVDWIEPAIELEGHVTGRLWPAAIIWVATAELARTWWVHRFAVRS